MADKWLVFPKVHPDFQNVILRGHALHRGQCYFKELVQICGADGGPGEKIGDKYMIQFFNPSVIGHLRPDCALGPVFPTLGEDSAVIDLTFGGEGGNRLVVGLQKDRVQRVRMPFVQTLQNILHFVLPGLSILWQKRVEEGVGSVIVGQISDANENGKLMLGALCLIKDPPL